LILLLPSIANAKKTGAIPAFAGMTSKSTLRFARAPSPGAARHPLPQGEREKLGLQKEKGNH
jgi:hypothetical protein